MKRSMKHPAAALFVGLLLVATVGRLRVARDRTLRPTAALARAVGPHRVTRARLTGGFSYADCASVAAVRAPPLVAGLTCAGASPAQWPESARLQQLAAEVRGRKRRATETQLFSAAWEVLWGEADTAVADFRDVARREPTSAEARADLAAALLERADAKQDPLSIVEAYLAADSAVLLSPKLAEARFNRALALEWLHLGDDADSAWSAYLQTDRTSPWADEARSHQQQLRKAPPSWKSDQPRLGAALASGDARVVDEVVSRFPWRARDTLQSSIGQWARAYEVSAPRSDSLLTSSGFLARALAEATGDSLWLEVVRDVQQQRVAGNGRGLAATVRGLIADENCRRYLARLQLDSANASVIEALRALRSAHNAALFLAMYDSAQVAYQRHTPRGYDAALAAVRSLRHDAPPWDKYSRGMAMRLEAQIYALRADLEAAVAGYDDAIREGQGTGEPSLGLRSSAAAAFLVSPVRGEREAWKRLYVALGALPRFGNDRSEAQRLATVAATLTERVDLRAALRFQSEAVRLAEQLGIAVTTVTALTREAELLARSRNADKARASARAAREYSLKIPDDSIRALYTAGIDLADGVAWLGSRPDSAIVAFRTALHQYLRRQNRLEVVRAQVLLAHAYMAAGGIDSAQRAFDGAVSELERRRAELSDMDRAGFLDQARPVIDTMLQFRLNRADTLGALEFLETMRARVLLERVSGEPSHMSASGGRVAELRRLIPPSTTVVSYALLDSTLVAWLIRRDGVTMYRSVVDASIEQLVDRFHTLLSGPSDEAELRATSSRLYELLIRPFRNKLTPETRLVFVPDKRLQFVPFAALFDSRAGHFLIESFEIGVAPSLELYAASFARFDSLRPSRPTSVLAVGDPAFDPRVFSLPRLPGAGREARRAAEAYPRRRFLTDTAATAPRFLEDAKGADVIHFAGHGVVSPDAPLESHLVLAPDPASNSSGEVYARTLYNASFAHTRLAVLSGCHTAGGELSDTEGVSSLARALFAAGVPAVVASLWAVDDEQTADFFAEFHRQVAQGGDPTRSLQKAELRRLQRDADPWRSMSTWAAFELFGATSSSAGSD